MNVFARKKSFFTKIQSQKAFESQKVSSSSIAGETDSSASDEIANDIDNVPEVDNTVNQLHGERRHNLHTLLQTLQLENIFNDNNLHDDRKWVSHDSSSVLEAFFGDDDDESNCAQSCDSAIQNLSTEFLVTSENLVENKTSTNCQLAQSVFPLSATTNVTTQLPHNQNRTTEFQRVEI